MADLNSIDADLSECSLTALALPTVGAFSARPSLLAGNAEPRGWNRCRVAWHVVLAALFAAIPAAGCSRPVETSRPDPTQMEGRGGNSGSFSTRRMQDLFARQSLPPDEVCEKVISGLRNGNLSEVWVRFPLKLQSDLNRLSGLVGQRVSAESAKDLARLGRAVALLIRKQGSRLASHPAWPETTLPWLRSRLSTDALPLAAFLEALCQPQPTSTPDSPIIAGQIPSLFTPVLNPALVSLLSTPRVDGTRIEDDLAAMEVEGARAVEDYMMVTVRGGPNSAAWEMPFVAEDGLWAPHVVPENWAELMQLANERLTRVGADMGDPTQQFLQATVRNMATSVERWATAEDDAGLDDCVAFFLRLIELGSESLTPAPVRDPVVADVGAAIDQPPGRITVEIHYPLTDEVFRDLLLELEQATDSPSESTYLAVLNNSGRTLVHLGPVRDVGPFKQRLQARGVLVSTASDGSLVLEAGQQANETPVE